MDGVGPVRGTDHRVFSNPVVWEKNAKHKRNHDPQPEELDEELETEKQVEEPDGHGLDLEA